MQKNSSKLAAKATEAAGWVRDLTNQVEGYAGAQAHNTADARPRWSGFSASGSSAACMAD